MVRPGLVFLFFGAIVLVGCGDGSLTSNPGTPPPHGGSLVKLPGGQGYVEIVKSNAESTGKTAGSKVAFYFLKDMGNPFSPGPASGTLTVGKKKIPLSAEGDALIAPGGTFASSKGEVDGVLSVELDGKSVNVPLGVR